MFIRPITPEETDQYGQLASAHGSVFSHPSWTGLFGNSIVLYGIYDKGEKLTGGFALNHSRILGFPYYTNPPITPSIGLFYQNPATNPAQRLGHDKEVLTGLAALIRKKKFALHRLCLPTGILDMQPFIWEKIKVIPHFTYRIELGRTEEELFSALSYKFRNNIRKAQSDGITCRKIENSPAVESMILEAFRKQKIRISENHIRSILGGFARPDNSMFFGSFMGESMVSVSFSVFDTSTAYYLFGGTHATDRHEGAGVLALWESIKHARQQGLKIFDLEGSMIPRIEKYFRGFGGTLTPYYTLNNAPIPVEMILKLFKKELF